MSKPKTRWYADGWEAFERGLNGPAKFVDCPHPVGSGTRRKDWWTGYLDARTQYRLGELFDKWGI